MPWSKISQITEPAFYGSQSACRKITWTNAIREALREALLSDPSVFIMGQGVDDPAGMFGVTKDLHKEFGSDRIFDTPLSETALTGIAVGAAQAGMKPVYFHNRPDFLYLAMDQLANHAAKWSYMFSGKVAVPMVVWACIGRGWGGAAQHSQALQALFAHIPGLKVVMPGSCEDAKGLMLSAISDPDPVIIIDHRFNMKCSGPVPEYSYTTPIGKGRVIREGTDLSLVVTSHLVREAWIAAARLEQKGISVEIFDPRTLSPLDKEGILRSLSKTGKLAIADTGNLSYGFTAEVAALASTEGFSFLKAPVVRIAAPDLPVPGSHALEQEYYFGHERIYNEILKMSWQLQKPEPTI